MGKFQYKLLLPLLLLLSYGGAGVWTQDDEPPPEDVEQEQELSNVIEEHNAHVSENRLAAQIYTLIEHYKQPDPVGLPGAPILDPMEVPDMKKNIGVGNLNMMKVQAHGLSKFRISSLNMDLNGMKVEAGILLDEMVVQGNYALSALFSTSRGPFTVVLKRVFVKCIATLTVERKGNLATDHIKMDISFADMEMDFQNLGFLGSVFQGIVNSAPNLVFDVMKPFMLQEADKQLRAEINKNVVKLMGDRRLPNSISPLDMAIAEGRKKVRALGYDPFYMPDYNRTVGVFSMQLSNTWIRGVSSFYRVGNMIVLMENNTVGLRFHIGTQELSGAGQWEVGCGLVSRVGHMQFTVQHIRLTVQVSQPLDTRKRPQINDLQIDLGNIQVRCDGAGTLDYILEFAVNVLPNLLRYQIMDAIENPVKIRIQEQLNTIDVEEAIKQNLDKFQNMDPNSLSFDFKL